MVILEFWSFVGKVLEWIFHFSKEQFMQLLLLEI